MLHTYVNTHKTASRYTSIILPNKPIQFRHATKIGPEILKVSMCAVRFSTKSSVLWAHNVFVCSAWFLQ